MHKLFGARWNTPLLQVVIALEPILKVNDPLWRRIPCPVTNEKQDVLIPLEPQPQLVRLHPHYHLVNALIAIIL